MPKEAAASQEMEVAPANEEAAPTANSTSNGEADAASLSKDKPEVSEPESSAETTAPSTDAPLAPADNLVAPTEEALNKTHESSTKTETNTVAEAPKPEAAAEAVIQNEASLAATASMDTS